VVIPLAMIVIDEFLEGPSNVALTDGQHPIEALELDRPHALRVACRRAHDDHDATENGESRGSVATLRSGEFTYWTPATGTSGGVRRPATARACWRGNCLATARRSEPAGEGGGHLGRTGCELMQQRALVTNSAVRG
jgi:hypothetical protein